MPKPPALSRRERQIMDAVYAQGEATVRKIQSLLPDPPTVMAVRRLLHILEEKGHVRGRRNGREVVYAPKQSKRQAGVNAFQHVLATFFNGALDDALAAHLASGQEVSAEELQRLQELIRQARKEGR